MPVKTGAHVVLIARRDGGADVRLRNATMALDSGGLRCTVVVPRTEAVPRRMGVSGATVRYVRLPDVVRESPGGPPAPAEVERRLVERDIEVRIARTEAWCRGRGPLSRALGVAIGLVLRAAVTSAAVPRKLSTLWGPAARTPEGEAKARDGLYARDRAVARARLEARWRAERAARSPLRRLRAASSRLRLERFEREALPPVAKRLPGFRSVRALTGHRRYVRELKLAVAPVVAGLEPDFVYVFDAAAVGAAIDACDYRRASGSDCELLCDFADWPAGAARRRSRKEMRKAVREAALLTAASLQLAERLSGRLTTAREPIVALSTPPPLGPVVPSVRTSARAADAEQVVMVTWQHGGERTIAQVARAVSMLPEALCVLVGDPPIGPIRHFARELRGAGADVRAVASPGDDFAASFVRDVDLGVHISAARRGAALGMSPQLIAQHDAGIPVVLVDPDPGEASLIASLGGVAASGEDERSLAKQLAAMLVDGPAYPDASNELTSWDAQIDRLESIWRKPAHALRPAAGPTRPRASAARLRLGIGPRNANGQAYEWSRAVRRHFDEVDVEAFAAKFPSAFDMAFPADHVIPVSDWTSRSWQPWWARHVLRDFSHLLIEGALTACGQLAGRYFYEEVPLLRDRGIDVGLVFRGSEIRDPRAHGQRHRFSPFTNPKDPLTKRLQRFADEMRPRVREFDGPVFVTTPDLLDDVPSATWLPHALDLDFWAKGEPVFERALPRVLHAPSQEQMKGSAVVDEVCTELERQGLLEYVRVRGVPYVEMPALLGTADVVIDQLALGSYGVLALQAMARGRVVIGHAAPHVRARLPTDLPMLDATPESLGDVLTSTLMAGRELQPVADEGRGYVEAVHDGRLSAARLAGFLGLFSEQAAPVDEKPVLSGMGQE